MGSHFICERTSRYVLRSLITHTISLNLFLYITYLTISHTHTHTGGEKILLRCAGKVATEAFKKTHPSDLADRLLSASQCVGVVDTSTVTPTDVATIEQVYPTVKSKPKRSNSEKPSLNEMLNVFDFESVARRVMDKEGWGYYSSGADDEITLRENHTAFQRIWLIPRVLVNVSTIDTSTRILGQYASLPLYFTATALGKLARTFSHPHPLTLPTHTHTHTHTQIQTESLRLLVQPDDPKYRTCYRHSPRTRSKRCLMPRYLPIKHSSDSST